MNYRGRCGEESVGWDKDVFPFNPDRAKYDFQRTGSAVDRYGMSNPAKLCEILLEFSSVFAQGQLSGGQNLLNPVRNP
jgi:hypothetical protein